MTKPFPPSESSKHGNCRRHRAEPGVFDAKIGRRKEQVYPPRRLKTICRPWKTMTSHRSRLVQDPWVYHAASMPRLRLWTMVNMYIPAPWSRVLWPAICGVLHCERLQDGGHPMRRHSRWMGRDLALESAPWLDVRFGELDQPSAARRDRLPSQAPTFIRIRNSGAFRED
jgi:hypothetical protein